MHSVWDAGVSAGRATLNVSSMRVGRAALRGAGAGAAGTPVPGGWRQKVPGSPGGVPTSPSARRCSGDGAGLGRVVGRRRERGRRVRCVTPAVRILAGTKSRSPIFDSSAELKNSQFLFSAWQADPASIGRHPSLKHGRSLRPFRAARASAPVPRTDSRPSPAAPPRRRHSHCRAVAATSPPCHPSARCTCTAEPTPQRAPAVSRQPWQPQRQERRGGRTSCAAPPACRCSRACRA